MIYKPMLDGFELELLSGIETSVEKALVEYEIPFANGGILDDMGVKARSFSFRTLWRRDSYDSHRFFIDHCQLDQVNRFVHPELGAVNGRVKSVAVTHDDRLRTAEIAVEFLEDANPDVQPAYDPPLVAGLEDGLGRVAAALVDAAAAEAAGYGLDTETEIDPDKPLGGQAGARTWAARSYLAKLDGAVGALRAAFDAVLNPLDSAVATLNYGLSLPGTVIAALAAAVERAAIAAEGAGNAPNMFVQSMRGNIARLAAAAPMLANRILSAGAAVAALFTGKAFAADEANKAVLRRIEDTAQWRPDGSRLTVPPGPAVLSADELDESLGRMREVIDDGVKAARAEGGAEAVTALIRQGVELAEYINTVKLERDRIVVVEAGNETPLHLLCLRQGLPYAYADRVCTINDFVNPTFCRGEVRLYERRR